MQFASFDLNLLRVFDAVMEERSVVRAGRRIGLTPSAVSHALQRLRHALGDELFVREADRMRPTRRANEIAPQIHAVLLQLKSTLYPPAFDPGTSARVFTIAAGDYASAILLPRLLRRIGETAPQAEVRILPAQAIDITDALDAGRVDFAIGSFAEVHARFGRLALFDEDLVYVMRASHPRADAPSSLEHLAELPHVAVSQADGDRRVIVDGFIVERGIRRRARVGDLGAVEQMLAEMGLRLRIVATVPHILAVPLMVSHSDMVAILPRRIAERFASACDLRVIELPFAQESSPVEVIWHARSGADPANLWLRNVFVFASGADGVSPRPQAAAGGSVSGGAAI